MGGARAGQGIVRLMLYKPCWVVTRRRVMTGSGNRGPSPGAACELHTLVADVTALFYARGAEQTWGSPDMGGEALPTRGRCAPLPQMRACPALGHLTSVWCLQLLILITRDQMSETKFCFLLLLFFNHRGLKLFLFCLLGLTWFPNATCRGFIVPYARISSDR